ncbi:transcriptional regulator [Spirochaeta africana DSM 8902]|uniref:Transcriptional regulator n=2 Tax=Spirochaeta TaxID=146 RepID=H9UHX0_SPIAZ|nr:transcriptional regulator [Spirochaeta africana DSM 8902]
MVSGMATIHDIARHTGLSAATVSRYLNGHPYVSKEAQLTIQLAIKELGYVPNDSARVLRSGQTRRIALVIEDAAHPFYSSLIAGVGAAAARLGHDILVQQVRGEAWHPGRLMQLVVTRAVDGVIIASELSPWSEYGDWLTDFPLVTCDQALQHADLPGVYIDHRQSTLDGLHHLYEQGARNILCLHTTPTSPCSSNTIRLTAFQEFAEGYPNAAIATQQVSDDLLHNGEEVFAAYTAGAFPFDAVFCGSDDLAAGILMAARKRGIAIPEQLKVLGFDDQPLAEVLGISTIHQPVRTMGERALEHLIQCTTSPGTHPRSIQIAYRLIHREST